MFDLHDLPLRIMFLIPAWLSLTVHEWAHAWSAYRLGDDTAAMQGRLNLNPFAHIDPIGSVLLPLLGVPFGWAKPVPVNPARFRRDVSMGTGMVVTALAGPASNVVLAVVSALIQGLLLRFSPETYLENEGVRMLLTFGITMNVSLALFNMLPIPPLDGSRLVDRFVPYSMRDTWESFARVSPFLLLVISVMGVGLIAVPSSAVAGLLYRLSFAVAGVQL